MDIKRAVEIISLIAGIILVSQTVMRNQRAPEVDNISMMAPEPYRNYATWYPGKGGGL